MRTVTSSQAAVYASALHARSSWAKVEVYSTITSAWVDLGSYLGYNWVKSVEISESIDSNVATATIECALLAGPQGELTASPFVTTGLFSYSAGFVAYGALLGIYKQIRISLAVMPLDVAPSSSDYMLKFRGRIQDVSVKPFGISLMCSDEMADLAAAFIESNKDYGKDDGSILMEAVIQSILNDWGGSVALWSKNGTGAPTFAGGDSPAWAIKLYHQERMTVMDAIKQLADQVAYDLRFRWQTTAADIKLVMQAPTRTSPSVDYTFDMSSLTNVSAGLSIADVRNYIRVQYGTKADQRFTATSSDSTSITAYGRRWMEISEELSSQIDTSGEAQNLADRAKSDLALPKLKLQGTVPMFPNAELGDYYTVTGDGLIMGDYSLGVTAITQRVEASSGTTALTMSGVPASRGRAWTATQNAHTIRKIGTSNLARFNGTAGNLFGNGSLNEWTRG